MSLGFDVTALSRPSREPAKRQDWSSLHGDHLGSRSPGTSCYVTRGVLSESVLGTEGLTGDYGVGGCKDPFRKCAVSTRSHQALLATIVKITFKL